MSLLRLSTLSLAAALSACAGPGIPYTPPMNGPTADITIRTETEGFNMRVELIEGPMDGYVCAASQDRVKTVVILNNVSYMNNFGDKGKNIPSFSTTIPADGQQYRFHMPDAVLGVGAGATGLTSTASVCAAHIGFIPEAGQSYELVYNSSNRCTFRLMQRVADGTLQEKPKQKYPICVMPENKDSNMAPYGQIRDDYKKSIR